MRDKRRWPVAASATVAMFVCILGTGNSAVTEAVLKHSSSSAGFGGGLLRALLVFPWRFIPQQGQGAGQIWLAQVLAIVVVLALVFGFVYLAAGGGASPGQIFAATWTGAVVACLLAVSLASFVLPDLVRISSVDRPTYAVFQAMNSYVVTFGLLAGLFVALVAAVVAANRAPLTDARTTAAPPATGEPNVSSPPPRD